LFLKFIPCTLRDDVTVYAAATRDNDAIYASYVNCIILATVFAVDEGITKDNYVNMPSMTLFGTYVSTTDTNCSLLLSIFH
jgi:hypothetical protein